MKKQQTVRYQQFVRVRNFGTANVGVFPVESAAGQKFAQLAELIASIEEQLVRRAQARLEARKVKGSTRDNAVRSIKALASTGRRAARGEEAQNPFRLPRNRSNTVVLTTARLFREEAEQRTAKFVELGMPPTFIADYDASVGALAKAVEAQQDSRASRRLATGAIDAALDLGTGIVADLDVTVSNALVNDHARLEQWAGAHHMDHPPVTHVHKPADPPAPSASSASSSDPALKVAS